MASPLTYNLSAGNQLILLYPYPAHESAGVLTLAIAAGLSMVAVVTLLATILISAMQSHGSPDQLVFVRTHVAVYFVSLLFSDLTQALGSLLSIRWVIERGITFGAPCMAQGAIKNAGNVGTALWSMVIAVHTFFVLFLGFRPRAIALYGTLFGIWTLIATIVVLGPGAIETPERGPYFGISGLWCWITNPYQVERLMLEYLWMFSSAFISFILYVLLFLKMRGNIVISGWRVRFRLRTTASSTWMAQAGKKPLEIYLISISKSMLWYPVGYTVLILPIAVCRYLSWAGHEIPFAATIFSDTVFMLSGFVNVLLFCSTRRVFPEGNLPCLCRARRRSVQDSEEKWAGSTAVHKLPILGASGGSYTAIDVRGRDTPRAMSPRSESKINANVPPPMPPKAFSPFVGSPRLATDPFVVHSRNGSAGSAWSVHSDKSSQPLTAREDSR